MRSMCTRCSFHVQEKRRHLEVLSFGRTRRIKRKGYGRSPLRSTREEASVHEPNEGIEKKTHEGSDARVEGEADAGSVLRLASLVGIACTFGIGLGIVQGSNAGEEYFAGYLLEQSLSVDNLFVFVLIFKYFQVPLLSQKKILDYGIYSSAVLRLVMVLLGTEILEVFQPMLLVFAGILIYSAYGILVGEDSEEEDLSDNVVVKTFRRLFTVSETYDEDRFFTRGTAGNLMATPLLVALATIEFSDIVFAVDSIPAVFGVTRDPFIVYSSNMFAIASLRSLFTFVATAVEELRFLQTSVGLVLGFIGMKMVIEYFGPEVPTEISLAVVLILLSGGVALSLWFPETTEDTDLTD